MQPKFRFAALILACTAWSCAAPKSAATVPADAAATSDAPDAADTGGADTAGADTAGSDTVAADTAVADAAGADQGADQDGNPGDSTAPDATAVDAPTPDAVVPDAEPADSKVEPDGSSDSNPATCATTATGNLPPGVTIELGAWPQDCTFSISAAAGKFPMPYRVTVDATTTAQVWNKPLPWGGCPFAPTGGGIAAREVISGQNAGATQQWCICDTGLCAPPQVNFTPLQAGLWPVDFVWDGNNWIGPSDYNNKPGPAMPPGIYSFKVVAEGEYTAAPSASATLPFAFALERTFELKP